MPKREIYTLNDLAPEVRAVTFAKCSRSPLAFKDIATELTEKKSSEFHEKWVVGYGHSSVAEHAVLSLAIENVSILSTKVIEDNRLSSYTEKSTRYQVYDRDHFYKPKKVMNSDLASLYENTGNLLFDNYLELFPGVLEFVKKKFPRREEPKKMYEAISKARALDITRYILPTATLTNLGWTINARNLEYAISKFLSHPLAEMQEIGQEVKKASLKATPTLIKYADKNDYMIKTNEALDTISQSIDFGPINPSKTVTLVEYDEAAEDKLVTTLLYRYNQHPYEKIKEKVKGMSKEEKEKIIDESLSRLGKFDRPLREFEHVYYTFDILVDYGAFRDIQRHRMATQTNQLVTILHGYDAPEEIEEMGLKEKYDELMKKSAEAFAKIEKKFPYEAQYIVPLAYKKRVLFTWNLRELFHFIKLRSGKMGHLSYRRVAQEVYDEVARVQPLLAKYIEVDKS